MPFDNNHNNALILLRLRCVSVSHFLKFDANETEATRDRETKSENIFMNKS